METKKTRTRTPETRQRENTRRRALRRLAVAVDNADERMTRGFQNIEALEGRLATDEETTALMNERDAAYEKAEAEANRPGASSGHLRCGPRTVTDP